LKEARQLLQTTLALASFGPKKVMTNASLRMAKLQESLGNTAETNKYLQLAFYYGLGQPEVKEEVLKKLKGDLRDESAIKKVAKENEYNFTYFSEQGENLVNQNKWRESLIFFQAAALVNPGDGNALVRLGEVTEKLAGSFEDFKSVQSFYQRAIDKDPKLTKAYIKLGLLEAEQYNLDHAYRLLKQAEALSPQEPEPSVALGKYFYKTRDYVTALDQFKKAFKLNASDPEILYYAGLLRLLAKKEGEKDAANFFYRAFTLNPNHYDALIEWLKIKVARYEKTFAVKFVRNLLEKEPNNPNLLHALGEVYAANKEYRRAITYYHSALDINNRMSQVRMSLARSLEAIGDLEKSIAEYQLASYLDPRNNEGFFRAADLYFQMKNYKGAEEQLALLIKIFPNYPGSHRYLSKIYQEKNNKDLAISEMQKEVTNHPMSTKYRVELAELYMKYDRLDNAITELTEIANLPSTSKAPEFTYDKIRSYLLLSRCFRAQNKFDSAEGAIRLALENDSEDPELHRELGYVYHGLQRDKEAVKAFEFYLTRNPAATDSASIRSLIDTLQIDR
jgi:tetratricopeptide (TPR) repeat protein